MSTIAQLWQILPTAAEQVRVCHACSKVLAFQFTNHTEEHFALCCSRFSIINRFAEIARIPVRVGPREKRNEASR